jgi:hypothetical protein
MKSRFLRALVMSASVTGTTAGGQTVSHEAPPAANSESGTIAVRGSSAAGRDSSRSYDAQALRFESRWGSADIVRGSNGAVIGTVGWFRDFDVEKLVESSPKAVTEARAFQRNNFRGSLASGLGALTLVTGIVVASNSSNTASSPILIIAGAGAVGWGAQHLNAGYAALSRAFWWYNRDLAH